MQLPTTTHPLNYLVSFLLGKGVEHSLDGSQGLVTGPVLPGVAGKSAHEQVGVQEDFIDVQFVADVREHAHHLPQALAQETKK